jgi:hypothetical protein
MLNAVEALPFSEGDRRTSEASLGKLVQGAVVPRVHTRSLPAIPDAATRMLPRPTSRWTRALLWSGAAVVLGVAAFALISGALRGGSNPPLIAAAPPRVDTVVIAVPETTAAPRPERPPTPSPGPPGTLRILANPASAEILIDGRRVGVGGVVDEPLPVGKRRIGLRASGYASFDTSVTVAPGAQVNLGRVVLRPRTGGS